MKLTELKSPFEKWPGSLWIPEAIDATEFNQWWEAFNRIEDALEMGTDKRHSALTTWESRFHLIKKSTLELGENLEGKPYKVEPTGLKLPSVLIAEWFIQETESYLDLEMDLKNALGPSTTELNTTDS